MIAAIENKIAAQSVERLMEMAELLNDDDRAEAGDVLGSLLIRLENVMPANDFIAFCDRLAA